MWVIGARVGSSVEVPVINYVLEIYKSMARLARFSIIWIILGGIPRVIFYKDFEWANAAGKNQVPALIVKHILFVIFISTGAYVWIRLNKKMKMLGKNTATTD
jgi:hypothetical protein